MSQLWNISKKFLPLSWFNPNILSQICHNCLPLLKIETSHKTLTINLVMFITHLSTSLIRYIWLIFYNDNQSEGLNKKKKGTQFKKKFKNLVKNLIKVWLRTNQFKFIKLKNKSFWYCQTFWSTQFTISCLHHVS